MTYPWQRQDAEDPGPDEARPEDAAPAEPEQQYPIPPAAQQPAPYATENPYPAENPFSGDNPYLPSAPQPGYQPGPGYPAEPYSDYRPDGGYPPGTGYTPDGGYAPPQYPEVPQYPVAPPPAPAPTRAGRHHTGRTDAPSPSPSPSPTPGPGPELGYPQGYSPQQGYTPTAPPTAGPPARVAPPRPEDLLVPNSSPVTAEPASWGWRGRMNRASGGLIKSKPSPEEVRARQAITDIQRSFSRPMTVVVVQPKGGAGKTPTTICLAAAFGAYRGGYVVGWDDNETRGTLAVRVTNPDGMRTTVWDLLGDLDQFERSDARVGDLSAYVRAQPDAHFDALVSDDSPGNMAQVGEREFHRLHAVLQRFYRMIVVDTGNNVRSTNWQAAVDAADMVVVVSSYQRDVGYSGSWVLDHLAQTGREDLARNAVTILTAADPTTDKTVRGQLLDHFQRRTQAIAEIPYDQELAHGGPIRWAQLAPATRNAWIEAGALIVTRLADSDTPRDARGAQAGR